jgi:hypothetical protein
LFHLATKEVVIGGEMMMVHTWVANLLNGKAKL